MTTQELQNELEKLQNIKRRKTELLEESKKMRKAFCANRFHYEIEEISKQIEVIESMLKVDPNQISLF